MNIYFYFQIKLSQKNIGTKLCAPLHVAQKEDITDVISSYNRNTKLPLHNVTSK